MLFSLASPKELDSPRDKLSPSQNLETKDKDLQAKLLLKTLSKNSLQQIVAAQKGSATKDQYFIVQVVDNRKKEGKSTNIKQRLMLSDGTSILIAMITEKFDKIEVSQTFKVCQFTKYSVIRIKGNMIVQDVNSRK